MRNTSSLSAFRKRQIVDVDEEEPYVDLMVPLTLHSKRSERRQKKSNKKNMKYAHSDVVSFLDLPIELFMEVFNYLRPSDIFNLARANKFFDQLITQHEAVIAKDIVALRYSVLEKCFRLPVLLEHVESTVYAALQREDRQEILSIHKKPYQHIQSPDPHLVCTCMTCMLRWNALNLVVDFAHWQNSLDKGEPIPIIARGKNPAWNSALITSNGLIVAKALKSLLWYARILEAHLKSTVHSIRRHMSNKGNKRRHFIMTTADVVCETDIFLERSGPPSLDFPWNRDEYYMLESYVPNRGWNQDEQRWQYMPASQHDYDLGFVQRWDAIRTERKKVT
ncbi:hypothetical protein MMC14_002742 [Varicellaria rhodocarpa]|nr:hypothetical protein [Varicellaria rhodocarpa]